MKKIVLFIFVSVIYSSKALGFEFKVFHTNDLHSYFEGSGPDMSYTQKAGDGDIVKGHYARLAYKVKEERKKSQVPTMLVDAGDFFAGTLFHALAPNKKVNVFPEAEFFKLLNYDATTLGNHEFDAGDSGLLVMLDKWQATSVKTSIVSTNLIFHNKISPLKNHIGKNKIIKPYFIRELDHKGKKLRVGILGLLGPDGALVSLGTRKDIGFIGFKDKESSKELDELTQFLSNYVAKIKKEEKLDIVMALLHGGHPEDTEILEEVPSIDLLIAGHTHTVYTKPIKVGNSILVQAGSFGRYLGKLELKWDGKKLNVLNKDTILDIDDNIPADIEMSEAISSYKKELDRFLTGTGFSYDSFIFTSKESLIRKSESGNELGVLVTSGVREELNKTAFEPIDLYFTSLGLIRKNIMKDHSYQLSDIFKIMAIGFDEEQKPGPKVVSFYLSKSEVFDLINFMEVYGMISHKFTPAFSNSVSYHNRWWGIPFLNKLGDLKLNGKSYDEWPEYIHVATSQFVAAYLPKVQAMSYGMLEFIPKDKNGKLIDKPYIHPNKEYILLAKYLKSQYKN